MKLQEVYTKVFAWMFLGLLLTFGTGFTVANNFKLLEMIFQGPTVWILMIAEFAIAIFLSARIYKMSSTTASICFIIYTILTGLTFSSIFVVYKLSSIIFIFGLTAVIFGIFAFLGAVLKIDLTKFGTYLFMILIGIIISQIVNIFLKSQIFDLVTTSIGIIVFMLYVAYDMQKVKQMCEYNSGLSATNLAIIGALELYLDFINIFIKLLRLLGKSRD